MTLNCEQTEVRVRPKLFRFTLKMKNVFKTVSSRVGMGCTHCQSGSTMESRTVSIHVMWDAQETAGVEKKKEE